MRSEAMLGQKHGFTKSIGKRNENHTFLIPRWLQNAARWPQDRSKSSLGRSWSLLDRSWAAPGRSWGANMALDRFWSRFGCVCAVLCARARVHTCAPVRAQERKNGIKPDLAVNGKRRLQTFEVTNQNLFRFLFFDVFFLHVLFACGLR